MEIAEIRARFMVRLKDLWCDLVHTQFPRYLDEGHIGFNRSRYFCEQCQRWGKICEWSKNENDTRGCNV